MKANFDVLFLKDVIDFLGSLDPKTRKKVIYIIDRAKWIVNQELFRKINLHIWEFRIQHSGNQIRVFAFWHPYQKALVICTHGIYKKARKTPPKEIQKAENIRLIYIRNLK